MPVLLKQKGRTGAYLRSSLFICDDSRPTLAAVRRFAKINLSGFAAGRDDNPEHLRAGRAGPLAALFDPHESHAYPP